MAEELQPSRRGLAMGAIFGFVGAICAGLGLPSLAYLFSPVKSKSMQDWVDLGTLDDLQPGIPRAVTFLRTRTDGWVTASGRERAWVVKETSGKVAAFSPWCTHLGCAFNWNGARRRFVCPCHDSQFAADGKRLAGPAMRPLDRYEVQSEGHRLWLKPSVSKEDTRS